MHQRHRSSAGGRLSFRISESKETNRQGDPSWSGSDPWWYSKENTQVREGNVTSLDHDCSRHIQGQSSAHLPGRWVQEGLQRASLWFCATQGQCQTSTGRPGTRNPRNVTEKTERAAGWGCESIQQATAHYPIQENPRGQKEAPSLRPNGRVLRNGEHSTSI